MEGASTGGNSPSGALDSEGRFRLSIDEPGAYLVHFVDESITPPLSVQFQVELARGEQPFASALKTGRLEGRLALGSVNEGAFVRWTGAAGERAWVALPVDDQGRFALPRVPTGEVEVYRRTATGEHERLGTVRVEPGATARYERR